MSQSYHFFPVGVIKSPFKEKFGIPRQAGLVKSAQSKIELISPCSDPSIIKGLESFSHLWLLFVFNAPKHENWNPTVRPPRLGGNKRLGVFATRSPFRPNPIGMSAVKLEKVEIKKGKIFLHISGADLLDSTPILDIKPYIRESDIIKNAQDGWLKDKKHPRLSVSFSAKLKAFFQNNMELKKLISEVIKQDPRPRYQENESEESYAFRLEDYDVHFTIRGKKAKVIEIKNPA